MKVLHYINNLGSGGAEKLLTDILPLMKEQSHDIYVVYSNGIRNISKYKDIMAKANIPIIDLGVSFYNPIQIFKIIRLLRKEKYDIVHVHLFPTQYWLSLASFFKPSKTMIIKTEHSVSNRRKNKKYLRIIEKIIYNRYNAIICISKEVEKSMHDWLGDKIPSVIIRNGVNLEQIWMEQKSSNPTDFEFLNFENFNILMVGRFNTTKDQTTLLRALDLLPENFHVFFAGEGSLLDDIKDLSRRLNLENRVHFLGVRSDIYPLMRYIDLNVLSSNHEGISGVTLESLASGKPFLGSDVPGINNIVPSDEFLFERKNFTDLAHKIKTFESDPQLAKRLSTQAVEFVKRFDIHIMADKYMDLYMRVIKEKQFKKHGD